MNRHLTSRTAVALWGSAAVLAVTALSACGSGPFPTSPNSTTPNSTSAAEPPTGLPSALVERVEAAYRAAGSPTGQVPELDSDAPCPLEVDTVVAGNRSRPFGAGVSNIGLSGRRAICDGTEPSTTLSVGHLDDPAEFAELEAEAGPEQESGNDQTGSTETVGNRRYTVVRTTYPTNDSHIDYTVTFTDPTQRAYAVLQVETTDEARQTYDAPQAARDLAAVLDAAA